MSAHTSFMCLPALLAAVLAGPAFAKPPDLPVDAKVTCKPQVPQPPEDSPCFPTPQEDTDPAHGLNVRCLNLLDELSQFTRQLTTDEPYDDDSPCADLVQSFFESLSFAHFWPWALVDRFLAVARGGPDGTPGMSEEAEVLKVMLTEVEIAPAPPADPTCPYLREQAARQQAKGQASEEVSVLDNLDKLQHARLAYLRGEFYRRTGHPGAAYLFYESVHRLCPGSRYDAMAAERMRELAAAQAALPPKGAGEEAEPIPPPKEVRPLETPRPAKPGLRAGAKQVLFKVCVLEMPRCLDGVESHLQVWTAEGAQKFSQEIEALRADGKARYLSMPQLTTQDRQPAAFSADGDELKLELRCLPRVRTGGRMLVEFHATIRTAPGKGSKKGIVSRSMDARIELAAGQTIVVGGLGRSQGDEEILLLVTPEVVPTGAGEESEPPQSKPASTETEEQGRRSEGFLPVLPPVDPRLPEVLQSVFRRAGESTPDK